MRTPPDAEWMDSWLLAPLFRFLVELAIPVPAGDLPPARNQHP